MKGNPKVIKILNELLAEELTAINQYFLHAEICESKGYTAIEGKIRAESIDEMKHAEVLIERILYLDGKPMMGKTLEMNIGWTIDEIFANDLKLEQMAVKEYNRAIAVCGELGDNGTRDLLQKILLDEEKHLDFIETQLALIKDLGVANYLAQQIQGGGDE